MKTKLLDAPQNGLPKIIATAFHKLFHTADINRETQKQNKR